MDDALRRIALRQPTAIDDATEGDDMRAAWKNTLAMLLALGATPAFGQQVNWRPSRPVPAPSAAAPTTEPSYLKLGTPQPVQTSFAETYPAKTEPAVAPAPAPVASASVAPASYRPSVPGLPTGIVFRGQMGDFPPPPPPPPGAPAAAPSGGTIFGGPASMPPPPPPPLAGSRNANEENFNCGRVAKSGGVGDFVTGIPGTVGGWFTGEKRAIFQSDHCFDSFISPVSNPLFFEDPRTLTELRPIFMYQTIPNSNSLTKGGNIEFFGLQGRLALTDWMSIVVSEFGYLWLNPNDHTFVGSNSGFSELHIGPKFTFIRGVDSGTIMAAGLNFNLATGESDVYQTTGDLSLAPYLSFGQNFLKSDYGAFQFLNTTGYSWSTDSLRSDFLYSSFHLDYDIANIHRWYPLIELNWFYYTQNGNARDLDFEGRDLFNFGSKNVSGTNYLSLAVGGRVKFTEGIQLGVAGEFPLISNHDLASFRLTVDMIFRY